MEGFQAVLATGSLLRSRIRSFIHAPDKALPFLQEGRLVQLLAASHPSSGDFMFWDAASCFAAPGGRCLRRSMRWAWLLCTLPWSAVVQASAAAASTLLPQHYPWKACVV